MFNSWGGGGWGCFYLLTLSPKIIFLKTPPPPLNIYPDKYTGAVFRKITHFLFSRKLLGHHRQSPQETNNLHLQYDEQ